MSSNLESAESCVAHALKRIRELEADMAAFNLIPPYVEVEEDDPKPGWKVRKVKFIEPIPRAFNHVFFDAANQLRAALDQAGFAVAVASGNSGKHAHFPFGDSLAEAKSRRTKQSKDIPSTIFDLMLSFKPYLDGDNNLWGLNKHCNANKHEVTLEPVIVSASVRFGEGSNIGPCELCNKWDSVSRELTLVKIGPGGSVGSNSNYSFNMQVGDAQHVGSVPVVQYLNGVAQTVDLILKAVKQEAIVLGLF